MRVITVGNKFPISCRENAVAEPVFEPDHSIVDPHIHLWRRDLTGPYLTNDLTEDLDDGHKIERIVYVECGEQYRTKGPEHLRSIGETEYAAGCAIREPRIGGVVANIDLCRGADVHEILAQHDEVSGGLLRGIRHAAAHDPHREELANPGKARAGILEAETYLEAVRALGREGLVNDHWIFFHQIPALTKLARSAPETTIVLNHLGTPLGVGPYRNKESEVRQIWRTHMVALSTCPNVFVKIGGLAMSDVGFGWDQSNAAPSSEEVATEWQPWIVETIDTFGPHRCMFESNFPVDGLSMSYRTLWNAFKKTTLGYSATERNALFSETATRVYRLED